MIQNPTKPYPEKLDPAKKISHTRQSTINFTGESSRPARTPYQT
jgi:hypothetical protein